MATVILLIAFTGIMSLMISNTYMNVRAKQRATIVNEANSYIERVREMKYDDIGTVSGTPSGALASYTTTASGYVIVVTPTVTPMTDPKLLNTSSVPIPGLLKKLIVTVTSHPINSAEPLITFTAETIIKKTDTGINEEAQAPIINPKPSPNAPTPDEVVWGSAVPIGAVASAVGNSVTLGAMNFYSGEQKFLRNQSGNKAQWTMNSALYSSPSFYWDTLATDEDGNPLTPDGPVTLTLQVFDSNGKSSEVTIRVIVDNSPPTWPIGGTITANPASSTSMNLAWTAVFEGAQPIDHYAVSAQKWILSGSTYVWSAPVVTNYTSTTGVAATDAFSWFQYTVTAVGPPPRNLTAPTSAPLVTVYSRPQILSTSTWKNVYVKNVSNTSYVTINISPAEFTYSLAPFLGNTIKLYKSTSPLMTSPVLVKSWNSTWSSADILVGTYTTKVVGQYPADQFYYQAVLGKTTGPQHYTQVVGPNGSGQDMTGPLTTVRW